MDSTDSTASIDYHRLPIPGKIEIRPTKACNTQDDLSLAYTPGVAVPCQEIHAHSERVWDYTAKGNMVAVVTDGTAVLGLGDIGASASLPVMEGKAVLFKRFAGIDAFPVCLQHVKTEEGVTDVDKLVETVRALEPSFGGINLEDIAAPACFEIEQRLKEQLDIPVFHDVGSGCLLPDLTPELKGEPVVSESVAAGADVLAFSGDKIMGGPQSGVIVGRKDLIQRIRKDPMWRAVRLDKLILRALQSTLALYFDPERRAETVPTLRLLRKPLAKLEREAKALAGRIRKTCPSLKVDTAADTSRMGSGSLPERDLPTRVVRLTHASMNASELADRLRRAKPPVIVRVHEGRVLIDPRTLLRGEADEVLAAVKQIPAQV